ncbi:MAG: ABC transporter substrate-binding protein, partial [Halobacteriaceae archaeon]
MEARGEKTVAINLEQAFGPLVATLVMFSIVDSESVKEKEQSGDYGERGDYSQAYLKENVAGTGPYTLKSWSSGNALVMKAFEDYWQGWEDNQFDIVRCKIVKEPSTTKLLMKNGKADITSQYESTAFYKEVAGYDNVEVPRIPQWQLFHLPLNTAIKPLDDINVRKAIIHAFDYETAINSIFGGG